MDLQETLEGMDVDKDFGALFNNDNPLESCWFGYGELMELQFLVAGKWDAKLILTSEAYHKLGKKIRGYSRHTEQSK